MSALNSLVRQLVAEGRTPDEIIRAVREHGYKFRTDLLRARVYYYKRMQNDPVRAAILKLYAAGKTYREIREELISRKFPASRQKIAGVIRFLESEQSEEPVGEFLRAKIREGITDADTLKDAAKRVGYDCSRRTVENIINMAPVSSGPESLERAKPDESLLGRLFAAKNLVKLCGSFEAAQAALNEYSQLVS